MQPEPFYELGNAFTGGFDARMIKAVRYDRQGQDFKNLELVLSIGKQGSDSKKFAIDDVRSIK